MSYLWIMFALFCWLVWVPFVTSLTWRVFMSHGNFTPPAKLTARQPKITMLLVELFDIRNSNIVYMMQWIELSQNWPRLIKMFFTDVFEGQIICSVIVIFGMFLLLLREHLMGNMEDEPALEQEQVEVVRANINLQGQRQVQDLARMVMAQNENRRLQPQQLDEPEHRIPRHVDPQENQEFAETRRYNLRPRRQLPNAHNDEANDFHEPSSSDLFLRREDSWEANVGLPRRMRGQQQGNAANDLPQDGNVLGGPIVEPEPLRFGQNPLPVLRDRDEAVQALLAGDHNQLERFLVQNLQPNEENPLVPPVPANNQVNEDVVEEFDARGFLDLVGIRGPARNLIQNLVLVHAVIMLCLTLGIWVPFVIGRISYYFANNVVWPNLQKWNDDGIAYLQKLTDPILDPIVDYLAVFLGNTTSAAPKIASNETVATTGFWFWNALFGASSVALTTTNPHSAYGTDFLELMKEDLLHVFVGYVTMAIVLMAYVNLAGMIQNRYLAAITRMSTRLANSMIKGFKVQI